MKHGNLFAGLPANLEQERFEILADAPAVRVERIVSTGQSTPAGRWYDQTTTEWVCLLRGSAALFFEGETTERRLQPGDWIEIPAGTRHQVAWTADHEPTVWLAVHYPAAGGG